jgi:hypothetical protein
MKKYYIGWDVGAWHCKKDSKSKDAFAIIDENRNLIGNLWETNGGTDLKSIILKTVKKEKDKAQRTLTFIKEIFSLCGIKNFEINEDDFFCIAIDTPLGWTKSFLKLLTMWSYNKNNKVLTLGRMGSKNNNPILTRETEKRFGNPLSVIQDQIGSQSTKAMYLLSLLKPSRESTGVWKTTSPNLTIIETYPAPCMRSLAFIEHMKDIKPKTTTISSSDKFDALICANLAYCFENPPPENPIDSPPAGIDPEGWIFAPKENILDSKFGISYPKLIGTKDLSELLFEIQIAIVLSAKEKKKSEADEWARANQGLFAALNTDDWAKNFNTLHPSWFKEGKKGKKDGKYHSPENLTEFKDFLETTINSLQQGNP